MYLSRLKLNVDSKQVWRNVVGRPYRQHQLVMQGFPDGTKRTNANVLFRLDESPHALMLLVQSVIRPDWDAFDAGLLQSADPFSGESNPAIRDLPAVTWQQGQLLRFRLVANPTVKKVRWNDELDRPYNGKRYSNRVPLVREERQREWLCKQGAKGGFRPIDFTITHQRTQTDKKDKKKGGHQIKLFTVQYEGLLQVTTPDDFDAAWRTGIGPAKAFGCGLLSLARA